MQRKSSDISPQLLDNLKQLFIFRDIPEKILKLYLEGVEELHLLKDEIIFRKGESYHKGIYFVLSGGIHLFSQTDTIELSSGDAIGISTFLGKTMYRVSAIADEDSDIIFIDEYSIYSLMDKSDEFREKFMKIVVERLNNIERMSTKTTSLSAYQSVGGCMSSPLITLHNSKTVADAARHMAEHNVGAVVLMNRKHILKGLLTTKHLTHKFLSDAKESPEVVLAESYADTEPLLLPQEYPLVETLAEMLKRDYDYSIITRRNKPIGIISKTDILGLLSNGSDVFGAAIAKIDKLEDLKTEAGKLPKIVENMMNNTSLFREILPTLSSNHLVIQKRAYALAKKKFDSKNEFEILGSNFCIISLGSLARREMTLELRQDHAMILGDDVLDKNVKHYIEFGRIFSEALQQVGYDEHPLGLCLINPDMIKRISEWEEFISESIHKSDNSNIGYSRVLFDCERFEGDESLLWAYRDAVQATLKEKSLFFGRLMNFQSIAKIPISQFGSFITEKDGAYQNTINMKENALDFIVYTVQAFSYYSDLLDVNTVRRIEHLGRRKVLSEELVRDSISAYESLVDLTLHEQLSQAAHGDKRTFHMYPDKLSMHSQEQLKRALHIVARFFGEGLAYFK